MSAKRYLFFVALLLPVLLFGYADTYTKKLTIPNGDTFDLIPIRDTQEDLNGYISLLRDPDTVSMQRDSKPWPVPMIKSTFNYYVTSWMTFDDLKKAGIKPGTVMGVCFLVHKDGKVLGSGGIQKNTRGEGPTEIYFSFLPPYRGKGLGTAMGKAIIQFYEQEYGRLPMEAIVRPENLPSKKLLTKLGFRPVLQGGQPVIKNFPAWNNTKYAVYRYDPA